MKAFVAAFLLAAASGLAEAHTQQEIDYARQLRRNYNYTGDEDLLTMEQNPFERFGKKSVLARAFDTWPNDVITYKISPLFTEEQRGYILAGVLDITDNTCIQLNDGSVLNEGDAEPEGDYIYIDTDGEGGCYYNGGGYNKNQGQHYIHLKRPGCVNPGTVTHEILHALGFQHEHKRPDRADHIIINWNNIKTDKASQFTKDVGPDGTEEDVCAITGSVDGSNFEGCVSGQKVNTFGLEYDLNSIMHYRGMITDSNFVLDTSIATITDLEGNPTTRANSLTALDIAKLKAAYNCPDNAADHCYDHIQLTVENPTFTLSSAVTPHNNCQIVVSAVSGKRLVMETVKFKFPTCNDHGITIYDWPTTQYGLVDTFCENNSPKFLTFDQGFVTLDIKKSTNIPEFELKFTMEEIPASEIADCCRGDLTLEVQPGSALATKNYLFGSYSIAETPSTVTYNDIVYPVFEHSGNNYFLSKSVGNYYVFSAHSCCAPGSNSGYAHLGPSDAKCPEDLTFVVGNVPEDSGPNTWQLTCVESTVCPAPLPAKAGGSNNWDGSTKRKTFIQYTCADESTRSYATCGDDGAWHYTDDRDSICHDDGTTTTEPTTTEPTTTEPTTTEPTTTEPTTTEPTTTEPTTTEPTTTEPTTTEPTTTEPTTTEPTTTEPTTTEPTTTEPTTTEPTTPTPTTVEYLEFCVPITPTIVQMVPGIKYIVRTPGYPGLYRNNKHCNIYFRSPAGTRIRVRAESKFKMQGKPKSFCKYDFLRLYRFRSNNDRTKICGPRKPFMTASSGSKYNIGFTSNKNTRFPGFELVAYIAGTV